MTASMNASMNGGLLELAHAVASSSEYPEPAAFSDLVDEAIEVLAAENGKTRPRSASGHPGGLVRIDSPITAIVPDLHGRVEFLDDLLNAPSPTSLETKLCDLVENRELTILCLGDILNTEGPKGADRWRRAAGRFSRGYDAAALLSAEMDEEMGVSLRALQLAMTIKTLMPRGFHCLKGNHDNIGNLNADGDSAFFKYAMEGAMGAEWFRLRYGEELIRKVRRYERLLPLVAVGEGFIASHAEPAFALSYDDIIEYRERPDVVRSLIWTENGEAHEGSVLETMHALLGRNIGENPAWLAGHRPVAGIFSTRAFGRLIQFHNPLRRQIAWIDSRTNAGSTTISFHELGPRGENLELLETLTPIHLDHSGPGH
jgi:hypothetical protein